MARIVRQLFILCSAILAFSLLIRKVLLDRDDPYRCHALRDQGRWLDEGHHQASSIQPQHWQPPGCILHNYNAYDIEDCLKCDRLLFAGDSDVRQLYWATAMKVNKTRAEQLRLYAEKHGDLNFEFGCSRLQFLWDPYLNSSALQGEIFASDRVNRKSLPPQRNGSQTNIVVGGGLWHARYLGAEYLTVFRNNVDTLFNSSRKGDIIQPASLLESQKRLLLFLPVLSPNHDMLSQDRNTTLTSGRLLTLNKHLLQASVREGIEILWSFSSMLQPHVLAYEEDGIHLRMDLVKLQADVILNLRCNAVTSLQHYPFDKSCCTDAIPYNMVQVVMLILALATIVLHATITVSRVLGCCLRKLQRPERVTALVILILVCIYCYLADRTHLFEKMEKITEQETFLWMVGLVMGLGLLTMGPSTMATRIPEKDSTTYMNYSTYLSRDQTEEWKGWMQFVILLYHYCGMSKILWVYQLIRLLVASYLFMTGFGHTLFFLKTNDFSLRRITAVLIRLNMLSVVLAYSMRTDYDFYYFPALSSFWFLVVCLILRFWGGRRVGGLQMCVSLLLLRLAVQRPGFLEKIVEIIQSVCRMRIDVHELRFRIGLDMYVVYVGMLSAIGYMDFMQASPVPLSSFTKQLRPRQRLLQSITVLAACCTITLYVLFAAHFSDKYTYNKWHAGFSPFPVLAFVFLRNATPLLRTYHSWLFAWLGRCSLETFILQYHVWLAADTKGLLRLGLCSTNTFVGLEGRWCRWIEFWIITVFFLWTSWEVSKASDILTEWIVGPAKPDPALGETGCGVDNCIASTPAKARSKLGLKFRIASILAILFVANGTWK